MTLKTYRVIIRRTIEVAIEIDAVSKASLARDMEQCQANYDEGGSYELLELYHRGIERDTRFDELHVARCEKVAHMAPITMIDNPDEAS